MRKLIFVATALGISGLIGACSIDAGVDTSGGGVGACEELTCSDALNQGLSVQGDELCDDVSASAYDDLSSCACASDGSGACDAECGDNFCADVGMTSDCGDCLNANCGGEFATCGNN